MAATRPRKRIPSALVFEAALRTASRRACERCRASELEITFRAKPAVRGREWLVLALANPATRAILGERRRYTATGTGLDLAPVIEGLEINSAFLPLLEGKED